MKNRIIIFLCLVLTTIMFSCRVDEPFDNSSDYFIKFIGGAFEDKAQKIIPVEDGSGDLFIIGTRTKDTMSSGEAVTKDMFVTRIDSEGNELDNSTKEFGVVLNDEEAYDLIRIDDNYYLVGTINNQVTQHIYIYKLDTTFAKVDSFEISNQNFIEVDNTIEREIAGQSRIVIGGHYRNAEDDEFNDIGFWEITTDGILSKFETYGAATGNDYVANLVSYDNNYYVAAVNWGSEVDVEGNEARLWIIRKSDFARTASFLVGDNSSTTAGQVVINNYDNSIYLAGSIGDEEQRLFMGKYRISSGIIEQETIFESDAIEDGVSYIRTGNRIMVHENGEVFCTGLTTKGKDDPVVVLRKFDSNLLEMKIEETMGSNANSVENEINSIIQVGNDVLMAGSTKLNDNSMIWLIKTTVEGKLQ